MVCKGIDLQEELRKLQFQSLLCWIMVCKMGRTRWRGLSRDCFNPCYVGLWSVSLLTYGQMEIGFLVSILVMLDYGL